jgi:hypothetical protein
VTVGFDHTSHNTGDVTGLRVVDGGFGDGGNRIIGVIIDSSLLRRLAISRLWRSNAWAGLSRGLGLGLASTAGRDRDRRGGRRTSVLVGAVIASGIVAGAFIAGGIVASTFIASTVVAGAGHPSSGTLGSELRNGGTGELVGSVAESVDEDTGVVVLVGTRESDEFIGAGGSGLTTANVELDAGGVELGASGLIRQMKTNDLMTKEVSTASEIGRELESMGLPVELILLDPTTVALAGFINLEPLSFGGVELVA